MTKLDYRIIGTLFCLLWAMPARAEPQPTPAQIEFFESRIRPVLVEHCYSCHNSVDTAEGGLSVDARVPLRQGGEGGPVVLPGNVKESRLLAILKHEVAGLEMPEGGPKLEPRIVRLRELD
ncbi:MAG: c-type cytochrome domain-containing protein [Planctomycetaceae bacterium]